MKREHGIQDQARSFSQTVTIEPYAIVVEKGCR